MGNWIWVVWILTAFEDLTFLQVQVSFGSWRRPHSGVEIDQVSEHTNQTPQDQQQPPIIRDAKGNLESIGFYALRNITAHVSLRLTSFTLVSPCLPLSYPVLPCFKIE